LWVPKAKKTGGEKKTVDRMLQRESKPTEDDIYDK